MIEDDASVQGGDDWLIQATGSCASQGAGLMLFGDYTSSIANNGFAVNGNGDQQVTGGIYIGGALNSPTFNSNQGTIELSGTTGCAGLQTDGSGNVSCVVSDERVKHNISNLSTSTAEAIINNLNPVSFLFNSTTTEPQGTQLGFLAQQVQTIIPGAVSTTSVKTPTTPHGTMGLNYDSIIAPLVKVVQEQQVEIQSLQAQINTLKK